MPVWGDKSCYHNIVPKKNRCTKHGPKNRQNLSGYIMWRHSEPCNFNEELIKCYLCYIYHISILNDWHPNSVGTTNVTKQNQLSNS